MNPFRCLMFFLRREGEVAGMLACLRAARPDVGWTRSGGAIVGFIGRRVFTQAEWFEGDLWTVPAAQGALWLHDGNDAFTAALNAAQAVRRRGE